MGVKFLMTLCITFLLGGIETIPNNALCQLGKQMNRDMSNFGCPVDVMAVYKKLMERMETGDNQTTIKANLKSLPKNKSPVDAMALYKNLMERMEADATKMTLGTNLQSLLKKMDVKSNMSQSDKLYQMAKLVNAVPVLGYSSSSDEPRKLLRDLAPAVKIDKTTPETILQTLLKDIGNTGEVRDESPVDILSTMLNAPKQNYQTIKTPGIYGQTDVLATILKVAEILKSQKPQPISMPFDFATLLKVLNMENDNKPKPEMSMENLQKIATYLTDTVHEPEVKIDKTTSETILQTLLKDIGNTGEVRDESPVDILSTMLNVLKQNYQTIKTPGIYGQTDVLATILKVAEILKSQKPQPISMPFDFATLLKVLNMENDNKPKPEMSMENLQKIATYLTDTVHEPEVKIDKTTSETILQTLLKDIGNTGEARDKSPVDILSTMLNVLKQNYQTIKTPGIYGQTDVLATILKVAEILKSQKPQPISMPFDFATLLKVLNMKNDNKPKPEMSMENLQKIATYQATLQPWETKFILEFIELVPPSLESKILTVVLDMIKINKRPLAIARSVVMLLPDSEKFKAIQTITKYEQNSVDETTAMSTNSKRMDLLKWPGWKSIFSKDQEYEKFEDMTSFIESSYGQNSFMWLHGLFNWMDKETWPRDLLKQVLRIINKNENVKASLVKNIMADKVISDFVYRIYLWMQTQNFSNSSSELQMIRQFILSIDFPKNHKDQWLQGFFNWMDGNFGDSGGWAKTIKVVSNSLVKEPWIVSLLKDLSTNGKIEVRLIIENGKSICNRSLSSRRQSIENILRIADGGGNLCGQKNVEFSERASLVNTHQKGKRIFAINGKSENHYFKWVIYIKSRGRILRKDVDVSYVPDDEEDIAILYAHTSAVA